MKLEERCQELLERKGGKIAKESGHLLLHEMIRGFSSPLHYVSVNWCDPLTPALIILSYEVVATEDSCYKTVNDAALAMSMLNLGVNLWDDIVDRTKYKGMVPTTLGKYGEGITLMIGGLAVAKAFSIIDQIKLKEKIKTVILKEIWNYCKKIAETEAINLSLKNEFHFKPEKKLQVIKMQAVNLEVACRMGALLGKGSHEQIEFLEKYGRNLSMILELAKDVRITLNLTLELFNKIHRNAIPYTLCFAKSISSEVENRIRSLSSRNNPQDMRELIRAVLETNAIENTISVINDLTQTARAELLKLPRCESKNSLDLIVRAQKKILLKNLSGEF